MLKLKVEAVEVLIVVTCSHDTYMHMLKKLKYCECLNDTQYVLIHIQNAANNAEC